MIKNKRYRIEYEREACIGAAACVAFFPEMFEMNEDGKADILKAEKVKNKDRTLFVAYVDQKDLKKIIEAAESCPVNVIHVIDTKTGKSLI